MNNYKDSSTPQNAYNTPNNVIIGNNSTNKPILNNNMQPYNLGSLNSLNPTNIKNYGVIYDNNNNINNNKPMNKNAINFNKPRNYNTNEYNPNINQINTNTSINLKKNNNQIQNNNINNKEKRSY